jgi:hypothetical protein
VNITPLQRDWTMLWTATAIALLSTSIPLCAA